ncbi:MAG: hypothetical protein RIR14_193 [Pseudomonadota bacterium]
MHVRAGLLCISAVIGFSERSVAEQSVFYEKGHLVQDLSRGLEWMRCSVGQRWSLEGETCTGNAVQLNHEEIEQIILQADEQLGPGWRLPTTEELESLLCTECPPPKIDPILFPATEPMPYWTGDRNFFAPRNYWSVNFMTGFTYGRFFPYQQQMVRLVRDRRAGETIGD